MCEEPLKSHHSYNCYKNGVPSQTFSASVVTLTQCLVNYRRRKWIRNIDHIKLVKPSSLLMFLFCFMYWV